MIDEINYRLGESTIHHIVVCMAIVPTYCHFCQVEWHLVKT